MFAERGFRDASIDAIARRAGISKALIYEHFPSKEALRASLLETEMAELFRRLAAGTAGAASAPERLRAGVDAFFSFVEDRRAAWRLLFDAAGDAEVIALREDARAQVAAMVATLMAAEQAAGCSEEARRRIEALAVQLTAGAEAVANWWGEHDEVDRAWVVERVMELTWLGLERLAGGERGGPSPATAEPEG